MESDFHSQIHQLSCEMDQLRLTYRDTSLKHKREQHVLKRIIASLAASSHELDHDVQRQLTSVQKELEKNRDVSSLIPQLAVLERKLKQHRLVMDKQHGLLDSQIKQGGETLQRIAGLPVQLKRDLRNLLAFAGEDRIEQAVRLLALYERALKIITLNTKLNFNELVENPDRARLDHLADELQQLISEIDFDGESGDLLGDIRSKLLVGVSSEHLIELTVQVLKLVLQGTNAERKASEQFLAHLNTTLAGNLKSMLQNVDQNHNYLLHRQELNQDFVDLVDKSQSTLVEARELDELKGQLSPLLAQMSSLSQRLKLAEEREQALQDRLIHSKNQIEAVFESTQDYRRRLEEQSKRLLKDPLTKVYNRTAFIDRLEHEYRRWIRAQHNLRVIMLDIDNFKAINDSYGYVAGDKALKIIARCINKEAHETDTIARFSGEEFVLLIPEREDTDILALIKRIQNEVSKLPFKFRDQQITITLTAVSTCFKDADNPELVMDRLNRLLQDTKKRGVNNLEWQA